MTTPATTCHRTMAIGECEMKSDMVNETGITLHQMISRSLTLLSTCPYQVRYAHHAQVSHADERFFYVSIFLRVPGKRATLWSTMPPPSRIPGRYLFFNIPRLLALPPEVLARNLSLALTPLQAAAALPVRLGPEMAGEVVEEPAVVTKHYTPMLEMVQPLVEQGVTEVPARFIQPQNQRAGASVGGTPGSFQIPVIDMSDLDGGRRGDVLAQLASACEKWGFFQITNHGVPTAIMADMLKVTEEFFALSAEEKETNAMKPGTTVGYGRLFETKTSVANWIDRLVMWTYGENQKLAEPCMPLKPERLCEVVDAYSSAVFKLCMRLIETLSVTLGLEPHVLGERLNLEALGIRTSCNYYPPCPQPELVLGLIPHADSSIFTVLQQDGQVSGLEILKDGQWYQVPPIKDAFVVNVGDQLQIMSNAKYKSVMHRVRTNTLEVRYSFPNFLLPAEETVIEPFPELISESNPPIYRSLTYGEYKNGFHFKSFANSRHIDNFLINPHGR